MKKYRKKVTLKDIAATLDVTTATVSKALRNSNDISFEMKEKTKKIAKELGYRPNILARSLIGNSSKILGVLIPDLRISFFSEAVRGMYEEANRKGYEIILMVHDEKREKEKEKLEFLSDIHVDGILLDAVGGKGNYSVFKKLTEEGIKFVCWDRKLDDLEYKSVTIDDKKASYHLTKKMISQGRENIVFLGPNTGIPVAMDRFEGYKTALKEHGISFNHSLVIQTFRNYHDSYKKMNSFLEKGIKIDGLVSVGGLITYGAGKAILDHNLSIPEDILLGEFGDNDIVNRLGVPFYTVNQNPYKIGRAAVDLLISQLESKCKEDHLLDIVIESEVLER
ncbi:MAG: LacI family DNA-binding transcriptional regulator [Ignavibacteriaceae bacterium]|nr:LacI family DNA-binding transcriptional regulator [Ignavibacteriaceae bacterium]